MKTINIELTKQILKFEKEMLVVYTNRYNNGGDIYYKPDNVFDIPTLTLISVTKERIRAYEKMIEEAEK